MIHPIFPTALKHPELVIRHLVNYVDLMRCEARDAAKGLMVQAIGGVVAVVALLVALALTGMAVMLGVLHGSFHWVLAVVPGAAWVIALAGGFLARRSKLREDIKEVQDEMELDVNILRIAKELKDE